MYARAVQDARDYLGFLGLDDLMMSGRGPLGLLVRLVGDHHLAGFHHALGGRHLDAARQHGGFAQDARGDRVPADFRPPVHLLRLVIGPGHLSGQVTFRVHGLQVAHVVVAFPGALHEQPATARATTRRRRRRRRHLLGGFCEPVHGVPSAFRSLSISILSGCSRQSFFARIAAHETFPKTVYDDVRQMRWACVSRRCIYVRKYSLHTTSPGRQQQQNRY